MYLLVKYGYYAAIDDINALIVPLVSMLNGMNDKLFPDATTDENNLFTMVRLLVSLLIFLMQQRKEDLKTIIETEQSLK